LLRTDGFIFISIDDGEVGNLRHLCDEVFGSENFIANLVWQKKYTRANDATFFSTNHDHVLVYAKNAAATELGRVPRGEKQLEAYTNPDDHPKGPWKATPLHARSGSNTDAYTFQRGVIWAPPKGTYRRYSDESMRKMEDSDEIWFGKDGSQVPQRKSFLSEVSDGMVPVTIWDHKFAGHNHEASTELKELGLGGAFTSPKPTRLIQRILQLTTLPSERHVAMDFFAGSGTTGDAVMRTNAEDGGNRRFVLVQLPEPLDADNKGHRIAAQYCEDLGRPAYLSELTKERLRRGGQRLRDMERGGALDSGFKVFKLDSSNIRIWEPEPRRPGDRLSSTAWTTSRTTAARTTSSSSCS
jgi:adenine-specific DNA-methyltransferase